MAATTFLNVNNGYGIKKINEENYLLKSRKYSILSPSIIPHGLQIPKLPQKIGCNKMALTSDLFRSKTRFILKCKAELAELNHAPIEEEEKVETEEELTDQLNHAPIDVEEKVETEEELSRATLLWRAAKIPLYSVALIPATVASAVAFWQTGQFSLGRYLMILTSFVIVNIWIKLSNDVYDFDTGADKNKKESVINIFGSRSAINFIAWAVLALGFSGFTGLAVAAKSARALILLTAAVFCFYIYQCPPYRLSYDTMGEPTLFTGFGPLATIGFYLLHSTSSGELPISSTIVWSSILVGYTTTLILFCSHFHQIEDDKAVGKISPLVRLGTKKASKVVQYGVAGLYALLFALGFSKTIPLASVILGITTLPLGNTLINFVKTNYKDKTKLFKSKYFCVGLHTLFGFALSAGFVIARLLAKQQPIIMV